MVMPREGVPAFVRLAAHPLRWRLMSELAESDYRVRELVARVDEPQNLVSYHLRQLRDAGLVTSTRSSFDGRDSYYHLDLSRCAAELAGAGAALHPALRPAAPRRTGGVSVLFVCAGNSARSPIAEALLRRHDAEAVTVASAGTRPRDGLHPHAIRVLRDRYGIDVSRQRPQHLDSVRTRTFDHLITLCDKAREDCPELPDRPRRAHWSIPDPSGGGYHVFEQTVEVIDTRVRHLLPVLTTTTDRSEVQP